jgi:hypothetical protein
MNDDIRIKKLKNEIKKNGYMYRLVERTDLKAIYAQEDYGFEVFKVKLDKPHPKAEEDIKKYDKVERFPCDEDFGKHAWTYKTLEEAQKRYAII